MDTHGNGSGVAQAIRADLQIVHQSGTALILRRQNLGMKVIPRVDVDQGEIISIMEHERRVSNYLPACCPRRKVTSLDSYNGHFAFSFVWVEGISLGAWLQQQSLNRRQESGDLMTRLQVAISIVKAVSRFHEAGVVHANIMPDNIILSFESKQCFATLIDLSKAIILSEDVSVAEEENKITDMKALGLVLYSLLGGKRASIHQEDDMNENSSPPRTTPKRGRNDGQPITNMPLYLISLLSSLIAPSKYQYQNVKDLLNDLQEAVDKQGIYLRPLSASDAAQNSVQIPKDSFYGRLSERSMVTQSLDVVKKSGGQPLVMAVSGFAGSGKTTLLRQITKPIAESNGFCIQCNFDRTVSPDTVLASAFNRFFLENLLYSNSNVNKSIRSSIRKTLGEHVK